MTTDSNSNEMNELWDRESISNLCSENCVSLKLDSESQFCKQFTQICILKRLIFDNNFFMLLIYYSFWIDSVNTYPTTYLIGNNGRPLEVIVGVVSEEGLLSRIQKAVDVKI